MVTKGQWEKFKTEVELKILNGLFEDIDKADEVFGREPYVDTVALQAFGVEVGPKYHRGHIHMTVEIVHGLPKYSISKLRKRMQTYLNAHSKYSGWNVWATLVPMYQVNYNNKEDRWDANDEVVSDTEVLRLSDDRPLLEIVAETEAKMRALSLDNPRVTRFQRDKGVIDKVVSLE